MWTFLIFIAIVNWYYFAIKSIIEKENKEKIFFIVFMTSIFALVMMIVKILWLAFINIILYPLFLFIVHWFYSDFILITRIEEYFLRNQNYDEVSFRLIIIKLLNKEIKLLKNDLIDLFKKRTIPIDITIITIWIFFIILFIFHILWLIDIFILINKIFN